MNITKKPLKQLAERNILIEKNDQIYVYNSIHQALSVCWKERLKILKANEDLVKVFPSLNNLW